MDLGECPVPSWRYGSRKNLVSPSTKDQTMRLYTFILSNLDALLEDWVAFARTLQPATGRIDDAGLLDHGRLILTVIASDMQTPQDARERQDKSEGNGSTASVSPHVPSRSHAREREQQGFNIEGLVAEYRALRATVLRQWAKVSSNTKVEDLEDITRFNEGVDQAIAESLHSFVGELDKSRDLYLGVLGHDLRGPLGVIANIATFDMQTRGEEAKRAAIVMRSVMHMKALLDDLVEYANHRQNAGLSIKPQKLHLGDFASNVLVEIAALREGHAIELKTEGDLWGQWDPRRMHQALSNLIFNALKYGCPDTPVLITLDGTYEAEVSLSVANSGNPIPPEDVATLFDPFVRGESGRHALQSAWGTDANMGLGLFIVRTIAEAHGGSVRVASNEEVTRFSIRMPRDGVAVDNRTFRVTHRRADR